MGRKPLTFHISYYHRRKRVGRKGLGEGLLYVGHWCLDVIIGDLYCCQAGLGCSLVGGHQQSEGLSMVLHTL